MERKLTRKWNGNIRKLLRSVHWSGMPAKRHLRWSKEKKSKLYRQMHLLQVRKRNAQSGQTLKHQVLRSPQRFFQRKNHLLVALGELQNHLKWQNLSRRKSRIQKIWQIPLKIILSLTEQNRQWMYKKRFRLTMHCILNRYRHPLPDKKTRWVLNMIRLRILWLKIARR